VCISWTIKFLILLMHGATVKFTSVCSLVNRVEKFCRNLRPPVFYFEEAGTRFRNTGIDL